MPPISFLQPRMASGIGKKLRPPRLIKKQAKPRPRKSFKEGEKVEVCSKEFGFLGSYYEAKVIKKFGTDYVVEYKKLVQEEDESRPLIEVVSADELRPKPPKRKCVRGDFVFGLYERVDAFDNDGWWEGRIIGMEGSKYCVYFDYCRQQLPYAVSRLRVHQDWINGKWA